MVKLYYYMDRTGFESIIKQRNIVCSERVGHGSLFPRGVFLTECAPQTSATNVFIYNFDDMSRVLNDTKLRNNLEFYAVLDSDDFPAAYKREHSSHEWVIPHDIEVGEYFDRASGKWHIATWKVDEFMCEGSLSFGYKVKN